MSYDIVLAVDGSSGDRDLEAAMAKTLGELFDVFKAKQASYGPGNISAFGEKGCIIRMNDKLQRLIRLVWYECANPIKDERVEDSYIDLADYALISLLVRRGQWPESNAATPETTEIYG